MNNLLAGGETSNTTDITNPALGDFLNNFATATHAGPVAFFNYFLPKLVVLAFIIGSLIFFFMLVTGAIQWIASGGDKQALEGARSKITNALVGLIILFASYAIIRVIEFFFGISILTLDIGPLIIR